MSRVQRIAYSHWQNFCKVARQQAIHSHLGRGFGLPPEISQKPKSNKRFSLPLCNLEAAAAACLKIKK
ncbi:maker121 [Drosophila busckii]|uniref:Maker121 n=1 Tax=Drosophila busckii TaxID=30019 RepID=A0A0M4E752_DROBS|nr:maker121 [Drosophila busckii]